MLALELPAGQQTVEVAYRCLAFWCGLALALVAAAATGVLVWRERRVAARSRSSASARF